MSFEASGALSGVGTGAFRCRDVHGADRELSTVFLKTYVAEDPASSKLLAWCFVRSGANRIGVYPSSQLHSQTAQESLYV